MILKNLTLRNFRKFKNTTVEFSDGVTGVVGLNGAGKSTIFEAIAWVLYGPVAARTPSDQIKRQGAEHSDPCRVELEFVFEGENYRIVREVSGKSLTASATATVNGRVAATSAETVSRFVQKKLGMDFKSFFTSIFAKQKELNALSTMNASERRPLILRMLGIDSLDDVIREVRSDKKNKDDLIKRLSGDLVDETGKNKDEIFKEKIKNLEKEQKNIETLINKSKKHVQDFKKELKELEKNYQKIKTEYEKLNQKREKLAERKTFFENKKKLQEEIKSLKDKIDDRKKIFDKEKKKLESFKNIEKDMDSTQKRYDELDTKLEEFVKQIEQKKTLSDRMKEDIKDIDSKHKNIEKLGPDAECPTCERVLSDQYNVLLKKFDNEKTKKQKDIDSFQKQVKTFQEKKEIISREQSALQKKKNFLQNQLVEKKKIETIIESVSDEINRENSEIEDKQKKMKYIGIVTFDPKEFESIKKQVEQLYEKYQSSLDVFNEKKDKLAEMNLDLEKQEGEKKLISQKIKNLQEKISELETFKKQIKGEKNTVRYLGMLSEVMADFRTFLISRIRPTLSSYASDFFGRLTDGKYVEVELDEDYDLLVYDKGESYSIERFSGGEEDLANLCLRLAISEVITERAGGVFNFIILDEIFGSQDMIRRHNIMKALSGLATKFRQIFLITHVEDVKDDMENILSILENEDGTSSVKLE